MLRSSFSSASFSKLPKKNTTKVDHDRLFGQRPPLSGEKETISRRERARKEISASLEKKIKLAVSNFEPFIESQSDIPTSSLGYFCGRMYRAFLTGAERNYF